MHFQRRYTLLLVNLNSAQSHFAPSPDYSAGIPSWSFPFQGQVFHLRDGKKKERRLDHIHICRNE